MITLPIKAINYNYCLDFEITSTGK